jgi:hypothetical protein
MSTSTAMPTGADTGGWFRRHRSGLALGIAVVLVLLAVTWINRDQAGRGGALDPDNAGPDGARAVARVLAGHGVPVDIVRGRHAFDAATLDTTTTVVVTDPDQLGASTWSDLDDRVSGNGSALVVAGLSPAVVDGFGLTDAGIVEGPSGTVPAECEPPLPWLDGLSLQVDGGAPASGGNGCFGPAGSRLLVNGTAAGHWLLTDPTPLTNAAVAHGDNAAVVLRLLGHGDRVVWYVASVDDTAVSDAIGVSRLVPGWVGPGLWLLGIAAVILLLVRGRRLGPLVVEPLPVAVKALESTTALGRLYERARDRAHAADLLVEGAARRLTTAVGLGDRASRTDLVEAVATRTGRPVSAVAGLLAPRDVLTTTIRRDTDLVELAQSLQQLEEEVRTR